MNNRKSTYEIAVIMGRTQAAVTSKIKSLK
jgi:hypothetical protein